MQGRRGFRQKAQSVSATVKDFMERGEYPSKAKVSGCVPGVSLADGRNWKPAEIWRLAPLKFSSEFELR